MLLIVKSCINSWPQSSYAQSENCEIQNRFNVIVATNKYRECGFDCTPGDVKSLLYHSRRKKLSKYFGVEKISSPTPVLLWSNLKRKGAVGMQNIPYDLAHLQSSEGFKIWNFNDLRFPLFAFTFFLSVKFLEISPWYSSYYDTRWHDIMLMYMH
jgi:hypothetical protein